MRQILSTQAALCVLALSGPAAALTLEFPGPADETGTRAEVLSSYRMPVGPFSAGTVQTKLTEGALDQSAWRIAAPGLTTLELLKPLRDQLAGAGYTVIFECEAAACGGFDFRYATAILPEPQMHVDLGDYRYLAAERKTAAGPEYLSLIVSRAVDKGFVQVTRVGQAGRRAPTLTASTKTLVAPGRADPAPGLVQPAEVQSAGLQPVGLQPAGAVALQTRLSAGGEGLGNGLGEGLAARLTRDGAQVLEDLTFASGSASLAEGAFDSLGELAAFLAANPQTRVMLVGHTDASGGLEANIALSRQRAQSVRQRLLDDFDIPPAQVGAEGVGFLSPRAPNDTEQGRLANRRVEVMVLATGQD